MGDTQARQLSTLRLASLAALCMATAVCEPVRAMQLYPVVGPAVSRSDAALDESASIDAQVAVPAPGYPLPSPQTFGFAPRVAEAAGTTSGLPSPSLSASFAGPFTGFPPDPVIAAGPDSLVVVTNDGIALLTKTGLLIDDTFPDGFDPKVVFDPHSQRFFALALDGRFSPFSVLRIRVSKTSTPRNLDVGSDASRDWMRFDVDADLDGGMQINNAWADFPSLGVDRDNLYVTAGMIPNFGTTWAYIKVWAIPKGPLLAGGPLTVFEYGAPPGPLLANPTTGIRNFWITATTNFDDAPEHLVAAAVDPAGSDGRSTLWTVNDPAGTPTLSGQDLLLPEFTGPLYGACPQLGGGANIDTGFVPIPNGVERDGSLWLAHTAPAANPPSRTEIAWYQIDPNGPDVVQAGRIGHPTRCYFYSAIQPDAQGNVAVVMSGVDSTIYPSAFYTARRDADPPDTMRSVETLRAGQSNYSVVFGSRNRWGDYGGISSDPVTDAVWMFHEYATATSNVSGTWIGAVGLSPPVDTSSFILSRARLRADTGRRRQNGKIVLRGVLDANDLGGDLFGALAEGLAIRVSGGGLPEPERIAFAASECRAAPSGAIACETADAKARFRPFALGPNLFKVIVAAQRRAFAPPLSAADVFGSLEFGGVERRDRIGNCTLRGSRSHVVRCRESGVVVVTPTSTVTQTATPTVTATRTVTPTLAPCAGDCDGSGFTTINELIIGLTVLSEQNPLAVCAAADRTGDGAVTIDEAVTAVGDAVGGCGSYPTGPAPTGPAAIELGVVAGSAGAQVEVAATLHTMGQGVASTQNDIAFEAAARIVTCSFAPAIGKSHGVIRLLPNGCTAGLDCTSIRIAVHSFSNFDAIADGAQLYTCTVAIRSDATTGFYPLSVGNAHASTPGGVPISVQTTDGGVLVGLLPPTPSATPTTAATATASATPTA